MEKMDVTSSDMYDSVRRTELLDSMLDWELMLDSRVADKELRFLEELEETLRNTDAAYTAEAEQKLIIYLLELIVSPTHADKARECLSLFIRLKLTEPILISVIADQLYDYFVQPEHTELAIEALKTLITELPEVDIVLLDKNSRSCQLALRLVESLAPKVAGGMSKENVIDSMTIMAMLLRHFGPIMRNHSKLRNMQFLGSNQYFCTGVELGRGSYANVFLGRNVKTAEVVAIKMMDWDRLAKGSKKLCEALENEIRVMKQSDHPNIVHLYDSMREGCNLNLILEYCGGGSLEEYLAKKGPLSEKETLHWLHELSLGLKFLYDRNIIHRDLKPGNLLLSVDSPTANLKITDFTFARFIEPGDLATTIVGTPLYMAPEMFSEHKYTDKSDLWSVGVIVYQMLTGTIPYKGSNVIELMENIRKTEFKFPENIKISADMKDLLKCLLQKEPSLRITWPEFFLHPCLQVMDAEESESEPMQQSIIATVIKDIDTTRSLLDATDTLRNFRAELEAKEKELKETKEELTMTQERLVKTEEDMEELATRTLMLEMQQEKMEQQHNEEVAKLVAEKRAADARIEELKQQVLLIATTKLSKNDSETSELKEKYENVMKDNGELLEQVQNLTKELEVYKVVLELEAVDSGVKDWKNFFSSRSNAK